MEILYLLLVSSLVITIGHCTEKTVVIVKDEEQMEEAYLSDKQSKHGENLMENAGCSLDKSLKLEACAIIIRSKDFTLQNTKVCDSYYNNEEKPLTCKGMTVELSLNKGGRMKTPQFMFMCPLCNNQPISTNQTEDEEVVVEKLYVAQANVEDRWFIFRRMGSGSIVKLFVYADFMENPVTKLKEISTNMNETNDKLEEVTSSLDNIMNRIEQIKKHVEALERLETIVTNAVKSAENIEKIITNIGVSIQTVNDETKNSGFGIYVINNNIPKKE